MVQIQMQLFNYPAFDVVLWFKTNLVSPVDWKLEHPDIFPPDASTNFLHYIDTFATNNYKVWDIQNSLHATSYLKLTSLTNNKSTMIAGRADFLVTSKSSSKADYLSNILCIIEIQSKNDNTLCEFQMLTYLLILMNTKNLEKLVGFLVYKDGQCRAFKAKRDLNNNCVYEMNDRFHVFHISYMLNFILNQ